MSWTDGELQGLPDEELEALRRRITAILDTRRPSPLYAYEEEVNHRPALYRRAPYYGRVTLGAAGEIIREPIDGFRTGSGTQLVRMAFRYTAADFELIERTFSGVSQRKVWHEREIFICFEGGEFIIWGKEWRDEDDEHARNEFPSDLVREYLSGNRAVVLPVLTRELARARDSYARLGMDAGDPDSYPGCLAELVRRIQGKSGGLVESESPAAPEKGG